MTHTPIMSLPLMNQFQRARLGSFKSEASTLVRKIYGRNYDMIGVRV